MYSVSQAWGRGSSLVLVRLYQCDSVGSTCYLSFGFVAFIKVLKINIALGRNKKEGALSAIGKARVKLSKKKMKKRKHCIAFPACHPARKDEASKAGILLHPVQVILLCERGTRNLPGKTRIELAWTGRTVLQGRSTKLGRTSSHFGNSGLPRGFCGAYGGMGRRRGQPPW